MNLGAQFYSIRTECQTPEALYASMRKIKEIGYDIIQISGVCDIEAERLKAYSDELGLPITATHKPYDLIVNDTENLIAYHKTIGCNTIGLGGMPTEYRASLEACREFIKNMKEPVKKIIDAGLRFSYHNHAFEFEDKGGSNLFELLFEEFPEADFLPDVYWIKFGGYDPLATLERIAKSGRVTNVHFKDMKEAPNGPICPCGEGVIDFAPLAKLCKEYGIVNIQVEQDNAPQLGDVFVQMKSSYDHLDKIVHI